MDLRNEDFEWATAEVTNLAKPPSNIYTTQYTPVLVFPLEYRPSLPLIYPPPPLVLCLR